MSVPWLQLLILVVVGAVAEAGSLLLLLRARPASLVARNYRQAEVVSRGGVTFAAPLILGAAVVPWLKGEPTLHRSELLAALAVTALFGLLGWLDDARGSPDVRGLKGHLLALLCRRQVTTGLIKALGGIFVGLWAAHALHARGWTIVAGGAVIALSANLINSADTRPGRAVKLFLIVAAALLALTWRDPVPEVLGLVAVLVGAVLAFAPADNRERVMLGDTGANPLGAVLGMAVVSVTSWRTWVPVAIALMLLSLAADRWSLSALLEPKSRPAS